MNHKKQILFSLLVLGAGGVIAQMPDAFTPDKSAPKIKTGMTLIWNDEFNINGKPDTSIWRYEQGFVRNQELQWYQSDNVNCINGVLLIEAKREKLKNPGYLAGSTRWSQSREFAEYTSASVKTQGYKQWQFGTFEIRARIDTSMGSWPAIWTLGASGGWPGSGETDIMEFYRRGGVPIILANTAWLNASRGAKWHTEIRPLSDFTSTDPDWVKKFHVWKMDWDTVAIKLSLDDLVINTTLIKETVNPDGSNPFMQAHYILLNLAIGGNGGDPSKTKFPLKYEVDYIRIYQRK